ncbi:hypothetical protein BACEGG_01747 [Bacteroides eggerthii DSM 20697]|nr:hypothetical protein BACEGG_01747 [Bacteroides eggerthii DSM 20697]
MYLVLGETVLCLRGIPHRGTSLPAPGNLLPGTGKASVPRFLNI